MKVRTGERIYADTIESVWTALVQTVLPAEKVKIETQDRQAGLIEGVTGLDFWSPGVRLSIKLSEQDNTTHLSVEADRSLH